MGGGGGEGAIRTAVGIGPWLVGSSGGNARGGGGGGGGGGRLKGGVSPLTRLTQEPSSERPVCVYVLLRMHTVLYAYCSS